MPPPGATGSPSGAAAEVVARKVAQYAQSRRRLAEALARRHGVTMSEEVQAFFAAMEAGRWDEIETAFNRLNAGGSAEARGPGVQPLWPAILDAFGAAEQAHLWAPQELLDYGQAVLDALRPGMVYVGGTDHGRWIPSLLNETSEGEQHVVLTQNALADVTYLNYLRLQYEDQMPMLSEADSSRAFQEYVTDAQKRYEHDRRLPEEPKQVRPGEDIRVTDDGRVNVSGQVAVMSINERLLQALMEKSPDTTFAVEESFPLKGTYGDALPLGPLMELRARSDEQPFTADLAKGAVQHWQDRAERLTAADAPPATESALKSYSHDTAATANLLAAHRFTQEAEQAYRLAARLWPENPEPVLGLAEMWERNGKASEARQLIESFHREHPGQTVIPRSTGPPPAP